MTNQTGIFNAQYLDTLELYKTEFGIDPPDDIWSTPKFDNEVVTDTGYELKRKRAKEDYNHYYSETPLCACFNSLETSSLAEFGGFDGGSGASGSWDGGEDNTSDAGNDGGSSCSSSCRGGD